MAKAQKRKHRPTRPSPVVRLQESLSKMHYGELRAIMLDLFRRGCCSRCTAVITGLVDRNAPEHEMDDCLRQAVNEDQEIGTTQTEERFVRPNPRPRRRK